MRISLICFNNATYSAITDHFLSLAISCPQVDSDNHFLTLVSNQLNANPDSKYVKNITSLAYSKTSIVKMFKTAWQIRNVLKQNDIERIFVFGENPLHAVVCLLFNGISTVTILDPKDHSGSKWRNNILYNLSRIVLIAKCRRIFLACPCLHQMLIQNFNSLFKQKYIETKITHLDYGNFYGIENIPVILKAAADKVYDLCYFGRIEMYKGIDFLFDSIKDLNIEKTKPLKILIISKNFPSKYKSQNVTVIDTYLNTSELLNNIALSKFAIMPYLDATGTHTVHLANLAGVPVIASDSGCFPYFIKNNTNGILFKSYDKESLLAILKQLDTFTFDAASIRAYNIKTHSLPVTTPNFIKTIVTC